MFVAIKMKRTIDILSKVEAKRLKAKRFTFGEVTHERLM